MPGTINHLSPIEVAILAERVGPALLTAWVSFCHDMNVAILAERVGPALPERPVTHPHVLHAVAILAERVGPALRRVNWADTS